MQPQLSREGISRSALSKAFSCVRVGTEAARGWAGGSCQNDAIIPANADTVNCSRESYNFGEWRPIRRATTSQSM